MSTDDERSSHPTDGDVLPDEAAVLADRGRQLDELDEDEFLTVDDAAERLGIDLD